MLPEIETTEDELPSNEELWHLIVAHEGIIRPNLVAAAEEALTHVLETQSFDLTTCNGSGTEKTTYRDFVLFESGASSLNQRTLQVFRMAFRATVVRHEQMDYMVRHNIPIPDDAQLGPFGEKEELVFGPTWALHKIPGRIHELGGNVSSKLSRLGKTIRGLELTPEDLAWEDSGLPAIVLDPSLHSAVHLSTLAPADLAALWNKYLDQDYPDSDGERLVLAKAHAWARSRYDLTTVEEDWYLTQSITKFIKGSNQSVPYFHENTTDTSHTYYIDYGGRILALTQTDKVSMNGNGVTGATWSLRQVIDLISEFNGQDVNIPYSQANWRAYTTLPPIDVCLHDGENAVINLSEMDHPVVYLYKDGLYTGSYRYGSKGVLHQTVASNTAPTNLTHTRFNSLFPNHASNCAQFFVEDDFTLAASHRSNGMRSEPSPRLNEVSITAVTPEGTPIEQRTYIVVPGKDGKQTCLRLYTVLHFGFEGYPGGVVYTLDRRNNTGKYILNMPINGSGNNNFPTELNVDRKLVEFPYNESRRAKVRVSSMPSENPTH